LTAWTVVLRGIRYRAGRSLVVFLLALVATTAAVLPPVYARAAQESVLTDGLRSAPGDATTLVVAARGTAQESQSAFLDTTEIRKTVRQVLESQPAVADRLDRPTAAVDTDTTFTARGDVVAARLAYRDGACAHLRLNGRCPTEAGQVTLSERSAQAHGIAVGDTIGLRMGSRATGNEHRFQVVGLYTPKDPDEAYWGRTVYFTGGAGADATGAERLDAMFTNVQDDVRLERSAALSTRLEYPIDTTGVGLDDVAALRDGITTLVTRLRGNDLDLATALPSILTDAAADQAAIGRNAPVIAVPLLLLCWFVLFLLVASLIEERGPEIALAKLRGFPAGRAARFGLGEALLLIALAAPFGLLAGVALVEVAARYVLAEGTHAQVRWPAFAAAGVSLLAAGAAAALAGRGTVRRPVLALLRRVPARTRWQAGLAEGIVVALAAASLVAAVGDRSAPLALLAPPLLAVVAGIATARVLRIWARLRLRAARRRGNLVTLLSSAQLSRRPAGQRLVVVVTVAVALLSFAATAWDVAAQARSDHARDALGAQRVYSVTADHPDALAMAVAKADPGGHSMAVVRTSQRYGEGSVELLGVQSAHLAGVATWRGHDRDAVTRLARQLHPQVAAALPIAGDLTVPAVVDVLPAKLPVRLSAVVAVPGESPRPVTLGVLGKGPRDYRAALPPACSAGCRLIGLALSRGVAGTDPMTVTMSVRGIRSGTAELPAAFEVPDRWRAGRRPAQAQVTVHPAAALGVEVTSNDSGDVLIEYVDSPDVLPAVLAGPAPADDARAGEFRFPGLAEQPLAFQVAARSANLPRAGNHGLLFDLDYAVRAAERGSSLADNAALRYEVWAADSAPGDLATRLGAGGVQVLRTETMSGYLDQLGRRAPALGLWLYLLAGAAAIVLALGVVLLTAYVGAQGRLYEMAALRVSGVRPSVLRRAVLREYRLLLGAPLLVGFLAGAAGAVVMLPGVPLVTVGVTSPALSYRPGFGALPLAVGVSVAGLALAVLMVLRMLRRATPDRLREGLR
jgi:putative ABC transport system permease protein